MSLRASVAAALAASSLVACSHKAPPPKNPEPPPQDDASLYNEPAPTTSSTQQAEESEAQLVAAQIRISAVIGQALRVGAAIWLTTQTTCPTPDQIVQAHLVSTELRSKDAWDTPYRITCDAKGPTVTSAGPDGKFDTPDDVVVGK